MKISCKQQDLNRGLQAVAHAVPSNAPLPILSHCLIATDRGRLKLSATNLEIGITCWVEGEVLEEGTVCVPARHLAELVGYMPQASVEFASAEENTRLNLTCQRSHSSMRGMDPAEFPLIPSLGDAAQPFVIEAAALKQLIAETAFAAATDDSRPVLSSVLVRVREERLMLAAVDGFRLAVSTLPLPIAGGRAVEDLLVPARTLADLGRILPDGGTVQVCVAPNRSQVLFHTESLDLVSRLIEGSFPNFEQIIPREPSTRVVVDTKEFAAKVRPAALYARGSSDIVRLKVQPWEEGSEGGALIIEATNEDLGDTTATIPAAVDGGEIQIIFNVKYLAAVLTVLESAEVALELTSAARPGLLRPVNDADYRYVIMPMHPNNR
jgi:DNA polymerase-3 subunit beta